MKDAFKDLAFENLSLAKNNNESKAIYASSFKEIMDYVNQFKIIEGRCSGKTWKKMILMQSILALAGGSEALDVLLKYIRLVDDPNFGYGIAIDGIYTFKGIPKEDYEILKEVFPTDE